MPNLVGKSLQANPSETFTSIFDPYLSSSLEENYIKTQGAGIADIIREKEARGEKLPRDAFGHVKLDAVKPGEWFGHAALRTGHEPLGC